MRSLLESRHYTSPEIHQREQERIFRHLWIFAGPRTLLAEPDSFVTRTIGGTPIVIQNFGGRLKAFVNRCAHRRSPLQTGEHGRRRLACPYHGWVYDESGKAAGIPACESLFGFDAETRDSRRLASVALECVGNLLFVNLNAHPLPMDRQFHREFLARIEHVSSFFDDEVLIANFACAYNWKLNFENVLDYHHVAFVHADSFLHLLPSMRPDPTRRLAAIGPPPSNSALSSDIRDLSFASEIAYDMPRWPWHDNVDRFTTDAKYFNWFIYPNVNFTSLGGVIFPIQQYAPGASNRTDYTLWMLTARQKHRNPATPAILWSSALREKYVIAEDAALLEALQQGLPDDDAPSFHGSYETTLRSMALVYLDLIA